MGTLSVWISSIVLCISVSDLVGCFSFKNDFNRTLIVSLTCTWTYLNSSSISFFKTFPKRATSLSNLWYFLIPDIIAWAHSIINYLSPYLWFRYVYIYCSIVSLAYLFSRFFSSCFFFWMYISAISSFIYFSVRERVYNEAYGIIGWDRYFNFYWCLLKESTILLLFLLTWKGTTEFAGDIRVLESYRENCLY